MEIKIYTKDEVDGFPVSGYWCVEYDGKSSDGLTWDEMLGQIAYMTCPKINRETLFKMTQKVEAA